MISTARDNLRRLHQYSIILNRNTCHMTQAKFAFPTSRQSLDALLSPGSCRNIAIGIERFVGRHFHLSWVAENNDPVSTRWPRQMEPPAARSPGLPFSGFKPWNTLNLHNAGELTSVN
jgi:hypothetical protein